MEGSVAVPTPAGEPQLKAGAISYISNVVISVASTAPGYSLAATLGFIAAVGGIGLQSPAVILVAFIPMGCIAAAYNYLNRADPDCGTTFAWVSKAMGPRLGWMSGWAVFVADILVMPSLASIASSYTYQLFGWDHGANSVFWLTVGGIVWIVVMTAICYIGIELSARTQRILLSLEVVTLAVFAVVALIKVYANSPAHSVKPAFSWFNPFAISSTSALVGGVLLAVFIYWGWDSGVSVNEESEDSATGPGRAAVVSTFILLAIYVIVATAAQAFGGTHSLVANQLDVFAPLGKGVRGSPFDKLLIIAVLTSASASTQTTILPAARTTLSMARHKALPGIFGRINPRYLSPDFSTIITGVLSCLVFVGLAVTSFDNLIADAFTSLALTICFYYGITGYACTWFYRHELTKSVKNFIWVGVMPTLGGLILTGVFVKAIVDYSKTDGGYAKPLFGIGSPVIITMFSIGVGLILLVWQWRREPEFFRQKAEVADPAVLAEASA
ncbi:MAG: hypothetical protein QOG68_943 [Solirubrobacteraceae bacterium]|nr:hypothetical protein [Solirubrobacteraceae bacterium]